MASYVTINNSEVDPDSPITADLMTKFRDNPIAVFTDDASVPTNLKIGMRLLGTLTTTSGTTQTLSSLVLTDYKQIYVSVIGLSVATGSTSSISINGLLFGQSINFSPNYYAIVTLDLTGSTYGSYITNFASGNYPTIQSGGNNHTLTNSSTSISLVSSNAAFDAGTVRIYGVR